MEHSALFQALQFKKDIGKLQNIKKVETKIARAGVRLKACLKAVLVTALKLWNALAKFDIFSAGVNPFIFHVF